ncbi:hypothetical protein ACGF0K_01105 [Streptomyces sp. NPDC048156]|uniref:hypothetical protein n=1 Tax=Streptomyces sp. NPDC048156 TaxID=3365502 RepID=UPI003717A128
MSDLKLFRVVDGEVDEIPGASVGVERDLQTLCEANMEAMLGIRFLATEYRTGRDSPPEGSSSTPKRGLAAACA